MNILYINHYAGSLSMGMEFRPYYLAREWQKEGHNVRIVGADFSHLRKTNPKVTKDFEIQNIEGVEYQWIKTREYQGNGVKRAITMFQFCSKLWLNAKKLVKGFNPDVVIASSTYPLDTYPAQRIAKIAKIKYVHEVHDMWPITPIELYNMPVWHPFVVAMQIAENSFCKHANKVVSILSHAKDYFVEHGMKADKFAFVSNGIILEDWANKASLPEEHQNAFDKAHSENKLVITFFGSHTRSYSLDYLLKAISKVDRKKLCVVFVGEGNYKEELIKMANDLGLNDGSCYFLPQIPKNAIPHLLENTDISYVGAIKNRMFRFGIGMNKLFDAMMGAKPILYAVDAPNNMIDEFNCGVTVEAEDVDALKDGIIDLLSRSSDELKQMGENGRKAVMENFNYTVLSKKFLDVIDEI